MTPAAATAAEPRAPAPAAWPRRCGRLAGWVLAAACLFACYLRLSQTRAVNSDGAGNALEAWAMLHGNVLLHGWLLTDVSFWTTELPQYLLVEAATGLTASVVHIAAAMTYTLLVLLAAALAAGRPGRPGRAAAAALAVGLMLVPQLGPGINILLSSPDHLGTAVPVLAVWLILDRARPGWPAAAAAGLLLGWAQLADPLVFYLGVLPLAGVAAARLLRARLRARLRWAACRWELSLAAAALAGPAAAVAAGRVITAVGGFRVQPVHVMPGRPGQLPVSLQVAGRGLLLLAGADVPDARPGLLAVAAAAHLAGVLAAATAAWLAARRFLHQDLVVQVVLTAAVIDLAAYVVSDRARELPATREIDVLLPLCAVLTGRLLGPRLAALRDRRRATLPVRAVAVPAVTVVLAGYLAGLAAGLARPAATAQDHRLARWLAARHLGTGLSGYWEADVVTLDSGDRVRIRPVRPAGGRIAPGRLAADTAWYDPGRASARYVVLFPGIPGYPGFTARRAVLAAFGRPARTYRLGRYLILVWHRNLLGQLQPAGQLQNSNGSSMRSPARKPGSSSGSRPG